MECPGCGTAAPAGAKFCSECGAALAAACAGCGHLNPRASRFCSECGVPLAAPARDPQLASPKGYTPLPLAEKILSGRAAMEGERKHVTVLFADVAGFTPLSENLDAEEAYSLMRRCFDLMLEEVHRYEGTVTQFLGDGILALFGAPIAHEDHAYRAVRAALGIQQALEAYQQELQGRRGILFRMRIGLNSGPVVVGTIGTDLNMTYTALGDTVNLGSRMQELAEPGTVLLSEHTHRLAGGYFDTRALGERVVRGKALPVAAYEVLRPKRWRSRVDLYAEQGLTPYVGRERELATLLDRLALARAGQGQVVYVQGEAGIGKSRLLYEARRRAETEGTVSPARAGVPGPWLVGRCISFGGDFPYLPVVDLLKDAFGIEEADPEREILGKVGATLAALGGGGGSVPEGDLTAIAPFLKHLLGVDPGDAGVATMDPRMRKVRTFSALDLFFLAAARAQPLVLVVEDLHWIDPLSEEYLQSLAGRLAGHPLLLVLTCRRGYAIPTGESSYFTHLELQPLTGTESAAVAEGLLGGEELPPELREVIDRKAEGNPFFVEEVTKSLLETGAIRRSNGHYSLGRPVEEISVPDTVQDVIMARLDRLPEEPKRALQTAAVIGREFTVRLLERTSGQEGRLGAHLRDLQSVELIYERALYPELAYMFKHALTQEVAYDSLLLARRRVLHGLVGDAIEVLYSERLEEQYEILAYHYERAEAWDRALTYLSKSGEKALAAFAPQQAVSFYDRALAVLERAGQTLPPERAIAVHFGRGQALYVTNDRNNTAHSFQAMLQIAQEVGDRVQEGMALYQLSQTSFFAHGLEDARDYADRARQLALKTGDPVVLAGSLNMTALVDQTEGNLMNARTAVEEGERVARQAGIPGLLAQALWFAGLQAHWRGDHARALEQFDEGLQIVRQHPAPDLLVALLWMEGLVHCGRGEYDQALEYLREHLELSARLGPRIWRPRALNLLGWVYMDLCHWDLAIQYNAQSAAEARVLGDHEIIRNAELNLGDCYLAQGQLEEAQRTLETVHQECERGGALCEEWMKWRYTQRLNASLGELWLARGDPGKAITFADACLATATATESRRNTAKGRRLRGKALLALGRLGEAEAELEEALRVARQVGNPAQLWQTLAALARLRQSQGRDEQAAAAWQEALVILEDMGDRLADPAMRQTLLGSAEVRVLREAVSATTGLNS